MFPFGYFGNNKLIHFKDLPEDFYEYRNDINLNNENLSELYVYNRFLFWHFNNMALRNNIIDHGNHDSFDRMSLGYNIEKLRLIDSTLSSEKIKNYLLKHITKDFVLNTENQSSSNDMIDFYVQKSTSDDDKTYLKDLVIASNKLKPGNILPNAKLIDAKGNSVLLSAQIDSATVIYCWSTNFKMHSRNSHYKIKELKAKYPEVNFIAINFNDNDFLYWKKTLRSF